jgi:hypothetical protein
MHDREHFRREVACRDTGDRPRHLQVFVTGAGYIALQSPPGEVALLAPSQIRGFQTVVTQAHIVAIKVRQA